MKLIDWSLTILIIILIIAFNAFAVFVTMYDDINDNWGEYKCNPSVMPFADFFGHDLMNNFYGCIQNTQTTFTQNLLTPVNHGMTMLTDVGSQFQETTQNVRGFMSSLRGKIVSIIEFIYGAFVNTIVEFQRLTISLKDLFFKIMGIVVTFLYFVDGSIKALTSLWKGPVGGAIRGVGKFRVPRIRFPRIRFPRVCFYGESLIPTVNTETNQIMYIPAVDIKVGDTLLNDTTVLGKMKLLNDKTKPMYSLKSNNFVTLVTDSHKIYNGNDMKNISEFSDAEKLPNNNDEYVYNFVTDKGMIKIGQYNHVDWNENSLEEAHYILKKSRPSLFNNFWCFEDKLHDSHTLLQTNNNRYKFISEIVPGDILENNNLVVGIIELHLPHHVSKKYQLITQNSNFDTIDNINRKKIKVKDYNSIISSYLNIN